MEHIVVRGQWGTVEWAIDLSGKKPAQEYFHALHERLRAKILALFKRLAETGRISDRTKFKQLGNRAKGKGAELWEFKIDQERFLGDFRPGSRFLVAHALRKKSDNLPPPDIARAVRILEEADQREKGAPS
jgi:phage-related protein